MTLQFENIDEGLNTTSVPLGLVRRRFNAGLYRSGGKRALDIILILAALPVIVPLIGLLAACIALDGGAPFYRAGHVGLFGRQFRMLKLRTMVPHADKLLREHLANNAEANQEWQSTQKLRNDPRVTRLGRFLRKTSLDELPQLWNVLAGEMSLVGPRPMLPEQRGLYSGLAYYSLRPGLTGPWQVSDRNQSGFCKRAEYDTEYYAKLSVATDIGLLIKTIGVVFRGTGY